jgi:hypothetical protein
MHAPFKVRQLTSSILAWCAKPFFTKIPMCKAHMDGETVLLDLSTGRYYTLNRLGSVIWELCTGHHTISDIHAVLSDRFDVAPERALDDLVTLVNDLIREGPLQPERR